MAFPHTSVTNVLLIDDHPAFSRLVELFANKWDKGRYNVTAVTTVGEATACLAQSSYDILLLDGRLSDRKTPGENAAILSDHFAGPIVLFSGLAPLDFGTSPEYMKFAGAISKDDLPTDTFVDQMQAIISKHNGSTEANE